MARIAVGGLMHESDSFVPGRTDYAKYAFDNSDRPSLSRGAEMIERLSNISCSSSGSFQVADERRISVLKSTCHFRADYQPIAETVLIAIAPGGHSADPARYDYKKLRRGVRLSPLGRAFGGVQ